MQLFRLIDVRTHINVNLQVLKPYVRRESGLTNSSQEALVDAIMRSLDRCVIVKPDLVGYTQGRFGVTEPHPFPQLLTREERAELEAAVTRGLPKGM